MNSDDFNYSALDVLASQTDAYMRRMLLFLQILYYSEKINRKDVADKVMATYGPLLEMLAENMEANYQAYQKENGEV